MASVINMSGLTFSDEQVRSINELIFEKQYKNPDLFSVVNFLPGIKSGRKVGYVSLMGDVGKSGALGCDPVASSRTASTSEITWSPKPFGDRIEQCYTDLLTNAQVYSTKNGVDIGDLTSTDWAVIVGQLLDTSLDDMRHRIVWFGDEDAANLNDTPDGTVTNGVNVNLLNTVNGLWKQTFTIVTGNSDRYVALDKNSQGTYEHQDFNDDDTENRVVTKFLKKLIRKADPRLRGMSDLMIPCTLSIYDQYIDELGDRAALESSFMMLQNGVKTAKIGGIPLVPYQTWDRFIEKYYDNGVYLDKPHRALLISKGSSLWSGSEGKDGFDTMEMFYDKKSRKNIIDFEGTIDAKIPESYMIQAGY